MVWLFALGIIWLMIAYAKFRKVVFWIAGGSAAALALITVAVVLTK